MQEKSKKMITLLMLGLAVIASILAIVFAMNQNNEGMYWAAYWVTLVMVVISIIGISEFELDKLYPTKVEGMIPTLEELEDKLSDKLSESNDGTASEEQ